MIRFLRYLALCAVRRRMRNNVDRLDWLSENVRYGESEIRRCQELQSRLQAESWALESPVRMVRP